jgi:hypothetical protein
MKIIPAPQLSMAWFQAHCGCVSGSYMSDVLNFTQKGAPGATRKTYMRTKLAELLTGVAIQDNYVSKEMLDGIEREPAGRAAYELQEGVMVEEVGFGLHDTIPRFGGSMDGLVGDDGFLELKCPKAGTHLQWALDGVVPEDHIDQIDAYFAVNGRAWCDFASFCPMLPRPLQLMVIRRERNQAAVDKIEAAVIAFNAEVDAKIDALRKIVGPFDLPAAEQEKVAQSELSPEQEAGLGLTDEDIAWAAGGFKE